jgi:hypothetical protein
VPHAPSRRAFACRKADSSLSTSKLSAAETVNRTLAGRCVEDRAEDYQLQMQAYALAVRELLPSLANAKIRVTLHFLDPNVEVHLAMSCWTRRVAKQAIDEGMQRSIFSADPRLFPSRPRLTVACATSCACAKRVKNGCAKTGPRITRIRADMVIKIHD